MTTARRKKHPALTAAEYAELANAIDAYMGHTGRAPSPAWLQGQISDLLKCRAKRNRKP